MMEAWGERSPVIFVTGSSTLKRQGAGGFKEIDDVAIAGPLTKYSASITDGERIGEFVDRAWKIATSGYPGPVPVELWTNEGKLHEISNTFEMSYLEGDYPEFLPRFKKAYTEAHRHFQEAVKNKEPFRVTQNDVLKAQVFVEAAHRSAQQDGQAFGISYSPKLEEFKTLCRESNLFD